MLTKRKALKIFVIFAAAGIVLAGAVTYAFDPFYQYHAPWFGMREVFFERDKQVIGSLRTLSYDSVILGSSLAENFDGEAFDEKYGCRTIKAIRASGSTAELVYYLETAYANQALSYVFWNIDLAALTAPTDAKMYSEYSPRYLYTDTILDDFPYLVNKDVLFKVIPQMAAYSVSGQNADGRGYDWSAGKTFQADQAMRWYDKPAVPEESRDYTEQIPVIQKNISEIVDMVTAHPETRFIFCFAPVSMMWWDQEYTLGEVEKDFYALKEILPALCACANAEVYYFQSDRAIICDLDNYMDVVHYSPEINRYMLDSFGGEAYRVTLQNAEAVWQGMYETYEYIITEGIYEYY